MLQHLLQLKHFQTRAASAPPTSGATMNTQRSANAWPPAKRAGPMERAGFTEVPVKLMQTRWMRIKDKPIAKPARLPAPTFSSVVPRTTKTKMKVAMISTRQAPQAPPAFATPLQPRPSMPSAIPSAEGVTTLVNANRIAPAMIAPTTWPTQ